MPPALDDRSAQQGLGSSEERELLARRLYRWPLDLLRAGSLLPDPDLGLAERYGRLARDRCVPAVRTATAPHAPHGRAPRRCLPGIGQELWHRVVCCLQLP